MSQYIIGQLTAASVPNAPTGKYTLFLDIDGIWKKKDDAGVVTLVSSTADQNDKVGVSSGDTTPNYLFNKIKPSDDILPLLGNFGFDEDLTLDLKGLNKPFVINRNPLVTDDDDPAGLHRVGQLFLNSTTGDKFIALDISTGAAVWELIPKNVGLEPFFLSPQGVFGTGAGWADTSFISDLPMLQFNENLTEKAVYMFFAINRAKFDSINPEVVFLTYSTSTAPSVLNEDVLWLLEVRYRGVGDSVGGPADESLLVTQTLTTQLAEHRQPNLSFILDRTKITNEDYMHFVLKRIGADAQDNYSDDVGIGQSGIILQTTIHTP